MTAIAFLGLGHMGLPMAINLTKAGHQVTAYDPVPTAVAAAAEAGITNADNAVAAVADADVVITMLPSGKHVLDVYADIVPAAPANSLFIDCSTIDVAESRQVHEVAESGGHRAVDAPVSGGVAGATAGTLTFMVGATEAVFADAEPLLSVMGKKIVHCGAAGNGQAAKICNNMILGISMIAVSEAFVLGEQLGLTNQALYDVASTASGQCWALTSNCPVPGPLPTSPANRDYQPGFATALMNKDLGLAARAVQDNNVAAELGLAAAQIFAKFAADGGAGLDFSAVVNDIRARSHAEQ